MKRLCLTALSCLFITNVFCQGFYVRGNAGYALPLASQATDGSGSLFSGSITRTIIDSVNYDSYNIKKMSFTSGVHLAFGLGYMFNEHVGIDGAIDLCVAPSKNTFEFDNVIVGKIPRNVQFVQKAKLPVMFTPSLVMQTAGAKLNLYSRFGIVLPVNTTITWDRIFTSLPGYGAITVDDETWEIKNKLSLGMSAAIGVQKKLNDRMKIGGEVSILAMSITTKQATLKQLTSNGQKYNVSSLPDSTTVINFSNKFKGASDDFYNQPAYTQPFSNVTLSVSVTYSLGGGSHKGQGGEDRNYNEKNFIKKHR